MLAGSATRRQLTGWLAGVGTSCLAAPAMASELNAPAPPTTAPAPPADPPTAVDTGENKHDQLTAKVLINGQGPFTFIVDTGANTSCVSTELAAALTLPAGPTVRVHTIVGQREHTSARIEKLQIGSRVQKAVTAPVLSMKSFDVDGVLGVDWLKGQRLVLGFANKRLEITASKSEYTSAGRVVVPARRRTGQLTIVDADLSGRRISAMIDSGSQFSLANTALRRLVERLDPSASAKITKVGMTTIAGENFSGEQIFLPFMRLGGLTLGNIPVVFADVPVFKLWDLEQSPTIMLGMDLLSQFDSVALDFGRSAVRFDIADG